jgi:hypothetical protein
MGTRITGNTFPVKAQLKAMGGKFDGGAWVVPDDKAEQAWALVGGKPKALAPAAETGADLAYLAVGTEGPVRVEVRVEEFDGQYEAMATTFTYPAARPIHEGPVGDCHADRAACLAGVPAALTRKLGLTIVQTL